MASVRHPNVISYLGICTEPACIVTEYCAKGSLTDVSNQCQCSCWFCSLQLGYSWDASRDLLGCKP